MSIFLDSTGIEAVWQIIQYQHSVGQTGWWVKEQQTTLTIYTHFVLMSMRNWLVLANALLTWTTFSRQGVGLSKAIQVLY